MVSTGESGRTFTVVSAHFGDLFWIEQLAARLDALSPAGAVVELVPIDQDRSSRTAAALAALPRVRRVLTFEPDPAEVAIQGHDHPAALNQAVRVPLSTTHLIVLDSDCLPMRLDWLDRVEAKLDQQPALVACDPARRGLSHPCLVVMPVAAVGVVDFAAGLHETRIDTGRLVGLQLAQAGFGPAFDWPDPAFAGHRGHLYLGGSLYHHGRGSFASSTEPQVRAFVQPRVERFYRRRVARSQLDLSWGERAQLAVLEARTRRARRAIAAGRRRRALSPPPDWPTRR